MMGLENWNSFSAGRSASLASRSSSGAVFVSVVEPPHPPRFSERVSEPLRCSFWKKQDIWRSKQLSFWTSIYWYLLNFPKRGPGFGCFDLDVWCSASPLPDVCVGIDWWSWSTDPRVSLVHRFQLACVASAPVAHWSDSCVHMAGQIASQTSFAWNWNMAVSRIFVTSPWCC